MATISQEEMDQSISDVESVVNLLAQLDEQEEAKIQPESIEMSSLGLASLYEPDEMDMDFLSQTALQRQLPSIALPSSCSHQQSSVIGEHGMPVSGGPSDSEQVSTSSVPAAVYNNQRSRFRGPQLEGLAVAYAANPFPTAKDKAAMASELQLDTRAVQVWFQNKRARERKSLGPMASEHLRRKTVKDGTFHLDTMGLQPGVEVLLAEVLASDTSAGPGPPHTGAGPHISAVNNVSNNVRITHDLTVHGEAWKMGGSAQWRVLSDARVKEVLGDFTLGGEARSTLHPNPEPS